MYRVLKGKGYGANVILENTDTKVNIVIGRASADVHHVLDEAGVDYPSTPDEWDLEVNKETAEALAKLAMPMKKPIRDQRKKQQVVETDNRKIDAMDVMLGLASYSRKE